nr:putative ribonuclease H-like domain-containing protein [Tanacetum cinerariifolium]
MATSTTEAEYVAAAHCCGQVLWIQNQLLDYGFNLMNIKIYIDNESTICVVKNPVFHSKTKYIKIRHHFTRDAYEKKLIQYQFDEKDGIRVTAVDLKLLMSGILLLLLVMKLMLFGLTKDATSAKRTAWNEFSCSMASAVICLATGRKFNFSKYIFDSMVRNVDSPSKFLMYPQFLQVIINAQVDDLSSHNTKYTSHALTQKVFANMRRVGKGFSGVETILFASMLVQPQAAKEEEEEDEQDKLTQALEIIKLKKRVMKLEKKKKSMYSGLKRLRKVGRITQKDVSANTKDVNAAEPTVFDDEEVTMTMAQTLIKMKAKKARLLDEQMAQRLHDEEVEKAAGREKDDLKKANVLQQQYDDKEENIEWNVVAEQIQKSILTISGNTKVSRGNQGITYDKVRPVFKREYKKVQTLFKPDKDVQEPKKKRVAKETLLHEGFKKLKAVAVSGSRSYWKIIRVCGITEAYQSFKDKLKGFDREDLVALWNLVKEKFSTVVPKEDKEKALWVELKILFEPNSTDVFWKLQW